MTNVSERLKSYYSREGKKIVFRNEQSLNELSLAMWTELEFRQIDASVLSRVINGERSFTSLQLKVFCKVLQLSKQEEEHLFLCLAQDRNLDLNQFVSITQVPSSLALAAADELTKSSLDMFYRAEYETLEKRDELIRQLADVCATASDRQSASKILGFSLYLHGRTILGTAFASRMVESIYPVFNQLIVMSKESDNSVLYAYAHALLGDAYYGAGGYSNDSSKRKYYLKSIKLARKAIEILPTNDHEYLYALRTLVASAYYAQDEQVVYYGVKQARAIIPMQPPENWVNVLHLSLTLDKALAAINKHSLLLTQGFTANYFPRRNLAHMGLHEISGIREEVETLLLLQSEDKGYIESQLKLAIELAAEHKFLRHKKHLNTLLKQIRIS